MVNYLSKSLNRIAFLISFVILVLCTPVRDFAQDLDVPYVPTPEKVVDRMLDIVDLQPSDYVIDLGSGDGRIVIAAAKRGAWGHGIDLDPQRIAEARANAVTAGVNDQVMFMEQNIFETDFSEASVVTMYLLPSVNTKLRPQLLKKLAPGTRVISHSFDMDEWKPDKEIAVKSTNGMQNHDLYYWVIPAKVSGTWNWTVNGTQFTMEITQKFQEIAIILSNEDGASYDIPTAKLHGRRISFRATNGSQSYIFSGRVEGENIYGMMQHHNGDNKMFYKWTAQQTIAEPMK